LVLETIGIGTPPGVGVGGGKCRVKGVKKSKKSKKVKKSRKKLKKIEKN
jgi:hypothetical protein